MIRADSYSPDVWEAICTPMHEILPASPHSGSGALFLGSWTAAVDTDLLTRHGVRAIVECHDAPWGIAESSSPSGTTSSFSSAAGQAHAFNRHPTSPTLAAGRPHIARSVSSSGVAHHHHTNGTGSGVRPGEMGRFKVAIPDSAAPDLLAPHLDGAVHFIRERLNRGENVLVHCQQGISRSPAVVCAYIMRERSLSYDAALQIVKSRRKCIKPNAGFEKTLRNWK
ncbi:hypothetical protein ACEPAI_8903 [Sanghuangporus weigelae]